MKPRSLLRHFFEVLNLIHDEYKKCLVLSFFLFFLLSILSHANESQIVYNVLFMALQEVKFNL